MQNQQHIQGGVQNQQVHGPAWRASQRQQMTEARSRQVSGWRPSQQALQASGPAPGVPTTMSTPSLSARSCAAAAVPPTSSSFRMEGSRRCLRNRVMLLWVCSARSLRQQEGTGKFVQCSSNVGDAVWGAQARCLAGRLVLQAGRQAGRASGSRRSATLRPSAHFPRESPPCCVPGRLQDDCQRLAAAAAAPRRRFLPRGGGRARRGGQPPIARRRRVLEGRPPKVDLQLGVFEADGGVERLASHVLQAGGWVGWVVGWERGGQETGRAAGQGRGDAPERDFHPLTAALTRGSWGGWQYIAAGEAHDPA